MAGRGGLAADAAIAPPPTGVSAAAVVTLGFGTGIPTAVFSLVDTALIKPLPYPDADRLVTVYESSPVPAKEPVWLRPRGSKTGSVSTQFRGDFRKLFESVTDTSGEEPERLEGRRVTPLLRGIRNATARGTHVHRRGRTVERSRAPW